MATLEPRYHSLDAARAFALLLGVVFHAAESFEPGVDYWAVMDSSPSPALGAFRAVCHSFRMELFFLIAGFFAHLLYHRRGPAGFVRDRAARILVPLIAGWLIIYPLLVHLWLLGASVSGRLAERGIPADLTGLPVWKLTVGFFAGGGFIERFDLTHLWFLHQLFVLYMLAIGSRWLWHALSGRRRAALEEGLDRLVAMACRRRGSTFLLAALSVPALLLMDGTDVDTPKSSLLPHLPTTVLFGLFFAFGWALHRRPATLEDLGRRWITNLMVAGSMVPVAFAADRPPTLHAFAYGTVLWGLVLGSLGLFVRFRRTPHPVWRYVADSSYWIYLAHLPLVVALQIAVAAWSLPWTVKFPLVVLASFPPLFLSYHWVVRATFIGAQLNGRRRPRTPPRPDP